MLHAKHPAHFDGWDLVGADDLASCLVLVYQTGSQDETVICEKGDWLSTGQKQGEMKHGSFWRFMLELFCFPGAVSHTLRVDQDPQVSPSTFRAKGALAVQALAPASLSLHSLADQCR